MQCIEDLLQGQQLLCPAFPNGSLHGSNYQVVIAHDLWLFLCEERCQNMLDIVLMSDEQITVGIGTSCSERAIASHLSG
jgi:hypothetical protein